jgi:hypothetical protein
MHAFSLKFLGTETQKDNVQVRASLRLHQRTDRPAAVCQATLRRAALCYTPETVRMDP